MPRVSAGWRARLLVAYSRLGYHKGKGIGEKILKRALRVHDVATEGDHGLRYALATEDLVQRAIYYHGAYEPASLTLMRGLLRSGDTMIDVGGHVGQYALHAAQVVGASGKVVVFEPSPRTHQYLLRNIAMNGFSWVTPVLGAVDQDLSIARMSFGDDHNWGAARRTEPGSGTAFFCLTAPLRLTLPILGIQRIDVLKIDVEGLEGRVLHSIDYNGPLRPRNIILEYLPAHIAAQGCGDDVMQSLASNGYEVTDVFGNSLRPNVEPHEFNIWARDSRA